MQVSLFLDTGVQARFVKICLHIKFKNVTLNCLSFIAIVYNLNGTAGMALLWVCFFQTIAIGWFFGTAKFCDCVEQMTGRRPGIFWFMCWKYFAPAVMAVS